MRHNKEGNFEGKGYNDRGGARKQLQQRQLRDSLCSAEIKYFH